MAATEEEEKLEKQLHGWAEMQRLDSIRLLAPKLVELTQSQIPNDCYHWARYYYAATYYREESTPCLDYALQANSWFEKHKILKGWIKSNYLLGNIYSKQGNFLEALRWYEFTVNSLNRYKDIWPSSNFYSLLCATYNNISRAQFQLGLLEETYKTILLAEKQLAFLERPYSKINVLLSMSNYLGQMGKMKESLSFLSQANEIAITLNDKKLIGICLANLGTSYHKLGNLDSSLIVLNQAWKYANDLKDIESICSRALSIGELYFSKDQFEQAEIWSKKALEVSTENQLFKQQGDIYLLLANIAIQQSINSKAMEYIHSAIQIQTNNQDRIKLPQSYDLLHTVLKKTGRFEEALEAHLKKVQIKDSILNEQTLSRIEELQTRYQVVESEKEIAVLRSENQVQELKLIQNRLYFLIVTFIVGVLVWSGWRYYRRRLIKAKLGALEIEQQLLRTQMNPHFTFNTLTSIQNYLLSAGKSKEGAYYLAKHAKMMRQILEFSRRSWISLEEEIAFLENYLGQQKMRHENKFHFNINLESSIDPALFFLPPMFLQPAVENAIDHGRIFEIPDGYLEIKFEEYNKGLNIKIIDNGIGRAEASRQQNKPNSYSSEIIAQRIELLKKVLQISIKYSVKDVSPRGTLVQLLIPKISFVKSKNSLILSNTKL